MAKPVVDRPFSAGLTHAADAMARTRLRHRAAATGPGPSHTLLSVSPAANWVIVKLPGGAPEVARARPP